MENIQYNQAQLKRISAREIEVARLAAEGLSIKETASQLNLTSNYIQNVRASLFKKLQCSNIIKAIAVLRERALL